MFRSGRDKKYPTGVGTRSHGKGRQLRGIQCSLLERSVRYLYQRSIGLSTEAETFIARDVLSATNANVTPVTFLFDASFPLVRKTNCAIGSEEFLPHFVSSFHQRVEVLAAGTSAMLRTLAVPLFGGVVLYSVFGTECAPLLQYVCQSQRPGWAWLGFGLSVSSSSSWRLRSPQYFALK